MDSLTARMPGNAMKGDTLEGRRHEGTEANKRDGDFEIEPY